MTIELKLLVLVCLVWFELNLYTDCTTLNLKEE